MVGDPGDTSGYSQHIGIAAADAVGLETGERSFYMAALLAVWYRSITYCLILALDDQRWKDVLFWQLILLAVVCSIPFNEAANTILHGGGGAEADIFFQGSGIGVGFRDISRLHVHELLVGFDAQ